MSAEIDPPLLGEVAAKPTEGALEAPKRTRDRARELRGRMSLPEVLLWVALRKRQAGGLRFRRQHPLGPYILDFYCDAARLAVEIDGDGHLHGDQPGHDKRRDDWILAQGISTLRFAAREVLANPEDVVATIAAAAEDRGYLRSLGASLAEEDGWRGTPEYKGL